MGQTFACGATRVAGTRPLAFAYQHMRFADNGWSSRRILAAWPFAPPSAVHSARILIPHSHHRRLSENRTQRVLLHITGLRVLYHRAGHCQHPNARL